MFAMDCNHNAGLVEHGELVYPDPSVNLKGTRVLVRVKIDEKGAVDDTAVVESSGYDAFDAAALASADGSTFTPKMVDCAPVTAQYLYVADFNGHAGPVTAMHVPQFDPGEGWSASAVSSTLGKDGVDAAGRVVAAWQRGDQTLRIAEYVTQDGALALDRAFALVHSRIGAVLASADESSQPTQICNGAASAQQLQYQFTYYRATSPMQSDVVVAVKDGTIYTIDYTTPQPAFDPQTIAALQHFCI